MTFDELVAAFQALKGSVEGDRADAAREREIAQCELDEAHHQGDEARHERDEYKKLYELISLELERTRRHMFGRKAEAVDPRSSSWHFSELQR